MKTTENNIKRPSWDEYFISLAELVASRGTCDRAYVGAVIIKNKRILSTGYNGAPSGLPSCDEVGHEMSTLIDENELESKHCIRTAHAEQNAINNAARIGVAIEGATIYCKMTPCYKCAQSIINSGIVRIVAKKDYHKSDRSKDILRQASVPLEIIENI